MTAAADLAAADLPVVDLVESDIELLPGKKKPHSSQAWMIA
jgi:hypothetical protein